MRSLVSQLRPIAAGLLLPLLGFALTQIAPAAESAPSPRLAGTTAVKMTAAELDKTLLDDVKDKSELMKNLEYLSDTIGPRLTGSKNLERANEWTAAKMKEYGLTNVKLEPWEIPLGWERGPATMTIVEPDTKVRFSVASVGWTPGTKGKVTGEVVILRARTKADLEKYKGKLKNAIVMTSAPANVAPITDLVPSSVAPPTVTVSVPLGAPERLSSIWRGPAAAESAVMLVMPKPPRLTMCPLRILVPSRNPVPSWLSEFTAPYQISKKLDALAVVDVSNALKVNPSNTSRMGAAITSVYSNPAAAFTPAPKLAMRVCPYKLKASAADAMLPSSVEVATGLMP